MSSLLKPGRLFFAIGMIALAILSLISHDFIIGRPPAWPEGIPAKSVWSYLSEVIVIISGIAILLHNKGRLAALAIGFVILLFSFVLRYLPALATSTWEGILWNINAYKTLALAGGAFVVAESFSAESGLPAISSAINNKLAAAGILFLSLFLIIAGCSHIKFSQFIIGFIPSYIPFHAFWTYFTAIALLAGGIGILIPQTRKVAALWSGVMIFGWFLLLHIPRLIATPDDPSDRMGICESLVISGVLFVLSGISPGRKKAAR